MEETKVINNDNISNTDIDTSLTIISENDVTDNELNNDNEKLTTQSNDNYTPILLILVDGTEVPTDEEEPVLLEDDDLSYETKINSEYEDNIPTMTFGSNGSTLCNPNYVIAITETDKNAPIDYASSNLSLSASFTNNDTWCSVIFESPLNVTFSPELKLNENTFTDYTKIIVPVVTCEKNEGEERNTVITFNINNFNNLKHSIKLNVNLKAKETVVSPDKQLTPCLVLLDDNNQPIFISNNELLYIHANKSNNNYESYIYNSSTKTDSANMAYFAMKDDNNNITDNLTKISDIEIDLSKYNLTTNDNNYEIKLSAGANIKGTVGTTSLIICNYEKKEETLTGLKTIKLYYNGLYLRDITVITNKI